MDAQQSMPADIATALVKAQAHATGVEKAAKDQHLKRYYASMDQIIAEARQSLAHAGLGVMQQSWEAPNGTLEVTYLVVHESGASWRSVARMPIVEKSGMPADKALATALTYCMGYFLRGLLNLPRVEKGAQPDERDDSDHQPRRNSGPKKPQPPQQDIDSKTGEVIVRAKQGSKHAGKDLREMSTSDLAEYTETVEGWLGKASGPKRGAVRQHLDAVIERWLRAHDTSGLAERFQAIEQRAAHAPDDEDVQRLYQLAEREYLARLEAEKGESRTDDEGGQLSSDNTSGSEAAE